MNTIKKIREYLQKQKFKNVRLAIEERVTSGSTLIPVGKYTVFSLKIKAIFKIAGAPFLVARLSK